jgi:ketosteroid isomerase-like protein
MAEITNQAANDEAEIRDLITRWSQAVCDENLAGIRADHDTEILMFDVPPPFLSRGLDAYMATWQTFFACQAKPVEFVFHDVEIAAGNDVAFATAIGRCADLSSGEKVQLEFRLTMGLRKLNGRWRIMHEHHSIPATT